MAKLKRCLGVDLGYSRIKVAEVSVEKGRVRVRQLLHADVDVPAGASEDERGQRLAKALRDLLKANKISTKDAIFAVPGQSVWQKVIALPRASEERLRRIVEYEARQQIPFPLDQTRYEYQVYDDPEDPEAVRVLLAAIRKDQVNNYVRVFRRTGLKISGVGVSSLALFNFHMFNEGGEAATHIVEAKPAKAAGDAKKAGKKAGDKKGSAAKDGEKSKKSLSKLSGKMSILGKKKQAADDASDVEIPDLEGAEAEEAGDAGMEGLFSDSGMFEEVKAYVNLGATMMDLAIGRQKGGGMVGFCRSIPHAGNEMTRAIQDALQLDSFHDAEEIKRNQTAVLSSSLELEGEPSDYHQAASEALTRVLERRIIGEMRRSLDYYISQPDGVAVDSVVLSGGHAGLPHLAAFIEEKMGLPVEVSDTLKNEAALVDDVARSGDWASGAVALGLALSGVGAASASIDFLPEELVDIRRFKERYLEVGGMVGMLAVLIGMGATVGDVYTTRYSQGAEELERRINPQAMAMVQDLQAAQTERQTLVDKYDRLAKAAGDRDSLLRLWASLILDRPPDVVLDNVAMSPDGSVSIWGECVDPDSARAFFENLKNRDDMLDSVTFNAMNVIQDPYKRFPGNVNQFNIVLKYREKINRLKATPAPTVAGAVRQR